MRRREFIVALSSTIAGPSSLWAQQGKLPVVGLMNPANLEARRELIAAFRQGLRETGFVEGRNVAVEFRWADGRNDQLPLIASDLVRQSVSIIVAAEGTAAAMAAKNATSTIPIVFMTGADPVELGFVTSLRRPGGNMTGVGALAVGTVAKRLQMIRDMLPTSSAIAFLRNPTNPYFSRLETRELEAAAEAIAVRLVPLEASAVDDLDRAFSQLISQKASALLLGTDPFFISTRDRIIGLANQYSIPTIYPFREDALAGGLVSYGASNRDAFRLVGSFTGRVLAGADPAELPVQQLTRLEMILNLKTASALGLTIPLAMLARADEVIE